MRFAHSTRWVIAGAASGLSAALLAGIAFAVVPAWAGSAPSGALTASTSPSVASSSPGTSLGAGSMGGPTGMMGGGTTGYWMTGSSMMGGGTGARGAISNARLSAVVRQGRQGASVDATTNTVTYTGHTVTLVALASPHGKPNMTWEIDGLVNPTVVIPTGAQLDVVLVNTDWGYMHGFELTTTPPPYPYMAMMGISSDFLIMPLPPRTAKNTAAAAYFTERASITTTSGTYHYLCPVPGHAAAGMFGTIEVG